MKHLILFLATLVIVGCNSSNNPLSPVSGNGFSIDSELVGSWGTASIEAYKFNADGSFVQNGGATGTWTTQYEQLVLTHNSSSLLETETIFYRISGDGLSVQLMYIWNDQKVRYNRL